VESFRIHLPGKQLFVNGGPKLGRILMGSNGWQDRHVDANEFKSLVDTNTAIGVVSRSCIERQAKMKPVYDNDLFARIREDGLA
jgi:hypothetical protein